MAYNDYPLWPDYVSYTETPIASLTVSTTAQDNDFAVIHYIGMVLLVLLI